MNKALFFFALLLLCFTDVKAQNNLNWPIDEGFSTRYFFLSSSPGPRNLSPYSSGNLAYPYQGLDDYISSNYIDNNFNYQYDFHRGVDIVSSSSSTSSNAQHGDDVVAIESGTVFIAAPNIVIIQSSRYDPQQFDDVYWYWKYTHIDTDPDIEVGDDITEGDLIGTIEDISGPHLDLQYYPPAITPAFQQGVFSDNVDLTWNPISRLQHINDNDSPIDQNGSTNDDEHFSLVFSQNDENEVQSYDSYYLEDDTFNDGYLFFGIRVDGNEFDFDEVDIFVNGFFNGNSFGQPINDAFEADSYSNLHYRFDNYAVENTFSPNLRWNAGDMDGGYYDGFSCVNFPDSEFNDENQGCDRRDDGREAFNDIRVAPRIFNTLESFHTFYLSFFFSSSFAISSHDYFEFEIVMSNVDKDNLNDSVYEPGDELTKTISIFRDAEVPLGQNITLESGNKYIIQEKLVIPTSTTLTIESGAIVYLKGKSNVTERTELISDGTNSQIIFEPGSILALGENAMVFSTNNGYVEIDSDEVTIIQGPGAEYNASNNGKIVFNGDTIIDGPSTCLMTFTTGSIEVNGDLTLKNGSFFLSNSIGGGTLQVNGDIYAEGSGNPNTGYVIDLKSGTTMEMGYNNKITIADGSKMRSVGTLADPVTFTYDGTYDPGVESWNGIELRGDGNIFEYTILEHGINPLYFRSDNNVVEYSTIRNNSSYGIRTDLDYSGGWGSVTITDSNIHDNGSHGVYMRKTHGGVQYTNIKDNGGDGMYVYDATVGNPNSSGSEYFRGNDIEDNSGNAVELAYNATLYDGYSTTDGNNNLGHNGSHEVYLSSTSARWHDANGGSYTAVLDNTSSKFVYNLAQTTSGESTISWTVGMENNAWNYVTPSSSKFFGSVDYTPFQTSQMFGSLGPRGSTPSEMNAGELPQMVLSASAVQAKTSGLHSDSERDAYLEQTREINKLMASINGNPQSRMVAKNLNGLIGYYNQLPENKKSEFNQVPEVLTNFIADKQLAEQVSFGEDGSRLTSETALMLQIHQQLQDGDPKGVLKSINKYKQTFSNLDIKRELGFIKANALEQLGKYDEAVAVYNELAILSRLGIDSENTATDYETLVSTLEELRAEHRGKDETSETNSLTEKVKEVVSTDEEALPTSFALKEAYPNPFNPSTVLSFDLPETGRVRVEVFNIAGQLVSVLTNQRYEAGSHSLQFNAEGLASGVYLVRANLAGTIQSQKVTLIK